MTGLPVDVHRVVQSNARLSSRLPTLAELLRDSGYGTAAIVRNPWLEPGSNLGKGFDSYVHVGFTTEQHGGSFGNWLFRRLQFVYRYRRLALPLLLDDDAAWTDQITGMSVDWLERNAADRFLLWVHYFNPHAPYAPPSRYLPDRDPPGDQGRAFHSGPSVRDGSLNPSEEERAWIRDLYAAEIRHVDANLGKLIGALKSRGLYEDALIVFLSDHGEEFWEHGRFEHGHSLHREVLHVPLMIKLPGARTGMRVADRVCTDRVLATVLDLCNIGYDGAPGIAPSLRGVWEPHRTDAGPPHIFSSGLVFYEDQESVIFGGMKFLRSRNGNVEELYDLMEDPGEKFSLVASRPQDAAAGRDLLDLYGAYSKDLRLHYGLLRESYEMDPESRERLRSLGYIR